MAIAASASGSGGFNRRELQRQSTAETMWVKPPPGPVSAFFNEHLQSGSGLKRNTRMHWAAHYYNITRGRSLIPMHAEQVLAFYKQLDLANPVGLRERLWKFTENHPVWNTFVVATIALSAVSDMVETEFAGSGDVSASQTFAGIEVVCVIIFTFELVLRLCCCPSLLRFVQDGMNWLDLFAILPWYASRALSTFASGDPAGVGEVSTTLRLLRLGRVLRIFKFARYSTSVRMFTAAVSQSTKSLLILIVITLLLVLLFGAVLYTVELHVKPEERTDNCGAPCFASILSSCWSVISTVTTTGYGDSTPYTPFGKFLITFAAVSGIVVLALPIAVFENNFARLHAARDACERLIQEISHHYASLINEQAIEAWLAIQLRNGRLAPKLDDEDAMPASAGSLGLPEVPAAAESSKSPKLGKSSTLGKASTIWGNVKAGGAPSAARTPAKPNALALLEAGELLRTYDLDAKGFLTEEEALIMMADLAEFHAPDDTQQLNAAVTRVSDQLLALTRSLEGIEDKLLHDDPDLERRRSVHVEPPQPVARTLSNVARLNLILRSLVTREQWAPPPAEVEPAVSVGLGLPGARSSIIRRSSAASSTSDFEDGASTPPLPMAKSRSKLLLASAGSTLASVASTVGSLTPHKVTSTGARPGKHEVEAARHARDARKKTSANAPADAAESTTDPSPASSMHAPPAADAPYPYDSPTGGKALARIEADDADDADADRDDAEYGSEPDEQGSLFAEATERLMIKWEDEAKQHGWSTWGW